VLVALNYEEMGVGSGASCDAVFRSQKTDGPLSRSRLQRIVRKATRNAGIKEDVS
jgi:site-specific recombinase XerD